MDFDSIKINNYGELVKLPWFEKNGGGQLRVKPGSGVPPILDMHTHLGWSYFGGRVIPYQTLQPKYMPYYNYENSPVNMEKDEHPTKPELATLNMDIALTLVRASRLALTHTAANILHDMDSFNTVASVILPIELPIRSRHAYQCVTNCKPHERLISFAAIHPWTKYKKLRLDWQTEQGCLGLKYHPEFQFCPPDTKGALEIFAMCEERGLPVLGHCGSTGVEPGWMQKLSHPEKYIPALRAFPKLQLILGHTAIIYYESALQIAKKFPDQVWLETSGQGVPVMRKIFNEFDKKRIVHGSDWTFFPLGVPLSRAMVALDGYSDEFKKDYFYRNGARALGLDASAIEKGRVVKLKK